MIGFANLCSLGLRRSGILWNYTSKIARTSGFENVNKGVFGKHVWKTNFNLTALPTRNLTSATLNFSFVNNLPSSVAQTRLFAPSSLLNLMVKPAEQSRSIIKFSKRKCKRKTSKTIIRRFYRLHWGAWIRTRAGKHKHMWKKSIKRRMRSKKHFFCNRTQSRLLNHMTTKYWKRRRFYVDDPFEPYHVRHSITRANVP